MFTVNRNPTADDIRKFGYAMLIGFWAVGALLWLGPWLKTRDLSVLGWSGTGLQFTAIGLQTLGVGLCLLSLAAPGAAKPVYVAWMTVAVAIGVVMSTVLLTALFLCLLPVFSLVVRAGDPLRKRLTAGGSYWEDYRPHEATLERMKRPF
jgi:hypothetical protein